MVLYRVLYSSGTTVVKTSPYMPLDDCLKEVRRFNNLPLLDLERQAMNATMDSVVIA